MNKILIIGQALPAIKQDMPYDTTMLYAWLDDIGISKEQAQDIFTFQAVYGSFTGFDANGGHLKPTQEQMDEHWDKVLQTEVELADKIWVLGNVAKSYLETKDKTWSCNTEWLYTIHPSKRNFSLFVKNKENIISSIRKFILS
jgi:hypothetical protein